MSTPVFPFRPNWRSPVLERLEWLTDVLEAKDATEERIQLRAFPRRSLEYELLEPGNLAARLDALLWGWQAGQYILPIWTDPQKLAAELTAGATSIPAATTGYDFYAGGRAVLWQDEENHEAVQIDSIDTDTAGDTFLTLSAATTNTWPAGTRLFPARLARLPASLSLQHPTSALAAGPVRFELDNSSFTAVADSTTYRGDEVNERRPNWQGGIGVDHLRKIQRYDYELGAIEVDDISGLPALVREHRYLLETRDEIHAWRGWLHARAGRFKKFWQPQWQHDLQLAKAIGASDNTVTVKALGAEAGYELDPGRQDIALLHNNGTWYFRRVTDISAGAEGEEVLTIDSALGVAIGLNDYRFITWLMLSRFDADAVEIAWHTAAVAVTAITVRSLRS